MRQLLLTIGFTALFCTFLTAQTGCPGCVVNLPPGLPADTIYLPPVPDGQEDVPYDKDYSFRMPMTTTPFAAIDSTTPSGFPISQIEILSMTGLPQGLSWQANQLIFNPATQTDGCIKICGTPTESDSFVLMVKVKVTVFIITQEVLFPLRMYIAPKVSTTDGFSMTNFTGCGATTVSFTNNLPSNGDPGITYEWDFGDGMTFEGENPPDHAYNVPGTYIVSYHATFDTIGYILQSATILDVDCSDLVGAPDLYMLISNPSGVEIYDSSPDINNATLPHTFPLNINVTTGNFTLEVWDEDSGLEGTDDPCGSISFNILSNDTIVSGGFIVVLNIVHPVDEVFSTDTVTVYALPPAPVISAPNGLTRCIDAPDSIVLAASSIGNGLQWYFDGLPIINADDSLLIASLSGAYQVQITDGNGCSSVSLPTEVEIFPLPPTPPVMAPGGLAQCTGATPPLSLISMAAINQWLLNGTPIANATAQEYVPTQSGFYQVQITDANGCTASSDSVEVEIYPLPANPIYFNTNNLLRLTDTLALPAQYELQWYNGNNEIPGETGFTYCVTVSGSYGLLVNDLVTGCSSFYAATVDYDPNFDCTVGQNSPIAGVLSLFPNPAKDHVTIQMDRPLSGDAGLRIWDMTGRLVRFQDIPAGTERLDLNCGDLDAGVFTLEMTTADGALYLSKLVLIR